MTDKEKAWLIGSVIREVRRSRKLTRVELARRAGLSVTTMYDYEHGETLPTFINLLFVAKALNARVSDLVCCLDGWTHGG